ncbi:unnamed protein product [Thlaspi arvense]|uniref:Neprosin PEP catalytic domain-containing protein n=1 Tax=Thlaspi arvense TaxID=13288 RepID=A0AAU9S907_THLAR|nr:unnamed protein product [Thlaspi arvense]
MVHMEPSFSSSKQNISVKNKTESTKIIECPNETVPILRNTTKYVISAQYWEKIHLNPLTAESHGSHLDHKLKVLTMVCQLQLVDQASYANIYVGGGVNPSLFGDVRTYSYGFWKGVNGAGCYNTLCHGFVQVSKTDPLSGPLPHLQEGGRVISVSIQQDKQTGHWWTTDIIRDGPDVHIGYWPKELFDVIGNSASIVGVTGAVQTSPSGKNPPMGNGHLPTEDDTVSAHVEYLEIIDSNYRVQGSNKYKLEKLLDNNKCYGLKDGKKTILFKFGGSGGDSCGI